MHKFESILNARLQQRESEGLQRSLIDMPLLTDFSSNDYLGLARSKELSDLIYSRQIATSQFKNGSTGSRLLSGNNAFSEQVEAKLANIFQAEASLIFNSGYTANLAVLSSLSQRGDTILYDDRAHASIKDGARLSLAHRFSFRHNDLHDLERKLKLASGKVFIVVESIYSMDGDICPLAQLTILAEKYDATIILDEAHSTGLFGSHGEGMAVDQRLHDRIAVRIYTFGKAMGIHGACVAGSMALIKFLINFARPFVYTTALPPHSIVAIDCAFDYLKDHNVLQNQLRENIAQYIVQMKPNLNESSAIQTAMIIGNERVKRAAAYLQAGGFDVRPIMSPTVPAGSERLRICLHAYNTPEEISSLTLALNNLLTDSSGLK